MGSYTYISIPCTFEDNVLTVKALNFKATGETPDQAILECIKSTPLYAPLVLCEFKSFTDFRGREFMHLEVPYEASIIKKMTDIEPYPNEKNRKHRSLVTDVSAEDMLKYAYPDLG